MILTELPISETPHNREQKGYRVNSSIVRLQLGARPLSECRRLHIVGGPGSGKTTLSRRLGERLGLPVIEVDAIRERDGLGPHFRPLAPLAQRIAEVSAIARQSEWITEGSALWWTDELLRASDGIIWLDVPWRLVIVRIIKRHVCQYYFGRLLRNGPLLRRLHALRYPHLRELYDFTRIAYAYHRRDGPPSATATGDVDDLRLLTRNATARCLAPYADKVIRCTGPMDLSNLGATHKSGPPGR